eukprot:gb/GECH01013607.1/.p1 GENE.gb/GECH01013607.1/~~gb/GECH01013607.1/.p1  ORF type:complete len:653 (+),score=189.76 gb/GECH01013607.1/:1-1959(+)
MLRTRVHSKGTAFNTVNQNCGIKAQNASMRHFHRPRHNLNLQKVYSDKQYYTNASNKWMSSFPSHQQRNNLNLFYQSNFFRSPIRSFSSGDAADSSTSKATEDTNKNNPDTKQSENLDQTENQIEEHTNSEEETYKSNVESTSTEDQNDSTTTSQEHKAAPVFEEVEKKDDEEDNLKTGGGGGSGSSGGVSGSLDGKEDASDGEIKLKLGTNLPPKKIVSELDRFIVGQYEAKRAVAIALRNRWRRHKLEKSLREEITPKNILMLGPTGVGKTEIARRLAKLAEAPFIKVEATKFTEVGFHGRDVDQIVRDLVDTALTQAKEKLKEEAMPKARAAAEERILDALVGETAEPRSREVFRDMLRKGEIDDNIIDIDLPIPQQQSSQPSASGDNLPQGAVSLNDLGSILYKLSPSGGSGRKTRKESIEIKKAMDPLIEAEAEKLVKTETVQSEAIRAVEEDGIVFVDEIDKVVTKSEYRDGHDASSEGVQRDLLPLIEGTTVSTKYGNVKTEHILFICSGAFHSVKPADMLAELQGRLPIRVELKGLTRTDLYRILTEPEQNLIKQQIALLETEGVDLQFREDAIEELANVAAEVNSSVENIGARRLYTVIERIIEEVSFNAPELKGQTVAIGKEDVRKHMATMLAKTDLTKFIL